MAHHLRALLHHLLARDVEGQGSSITAESVQEQMLCPMAYSNRIDELTLHSCDVTYICQSATKKNLIPDHFRNFSRGTVPSVIGNQDSSHWEFPILVSAAPPAKGAGRGDGAASEEQWMRGVRPQSPSGDLSSLACGWVPHASRRSPISSLAGRMDSESFISGWAIASITSRRSKRRSGCPAPAFSARPVSKRAIATALMAVMP